jgi:DNA polymerase I-like protein with 3'-5' exonuclease and polymerase domains
MSTLILDAETSVDNTLIGEDRASPFYKENTVVALGTKFNYVKLSYGEGVKDHAENALSNATVLVGQNIRFDMHYLHKLLGPIFEEWLYNPEHLIWDTQLAEYLLTAQQHKYASLDELSLKYGGTIKDDKIKAYWEAGVRTEDIPKDELLEYLEHDVLNTELVYLQQLETAEAVGMLPLIRTQMKALVATWEMMKNGMCFNMWRALEQADKIEIQMNRLLEEIQVVVDKAHPLSLGLSPTSNDVLSRLLFGGPYTYKTTEVVLDEHGSPVVFKTGLKKGQQKTRSVEAVDYVKGMVSPQEDWKAAKQGFFSVGKGTVEALLQSRDTPEEARWLLEKVETLRAMVKDRETYFIGFSKLAWPQEDGTHRIHGKLNHTSTDTGRLSSSAPNLQNASNQSRGD